MIKAFCFPCVTEEVLLIFDGCEKSSNPIHDGAVMKMKWPGHKVIESIFQMCKYPAHLTAMLTVKLRRHEKNLLKIEQIISYRKLPFLFGCYDAHSPGQAASLSTQQNNKEDFIMTTRYYTLEELQKRKEQTAHRIVAYEQRMKRIAARQRSLSRQIAAQAETERRNHLLARGELLESFLPSAEKLTDDQLRKLLGYAFRQESTRSFLAQITNEPEGGEPHDDQPNL